MRIIRSFLGCVGTALVFTAILGKPALAVKQRYNRAYQKKTPYFQSKTPYYQERDLPNSMARMDVSRNAVKVTTEYQPAKTAFKIERENILCRGAETFSCTYFEVGFSTETDCEKSLIVLKIEEKQPMTVEISSLYPKGSCRFDAILKHELTHTGAHRKNLNGFIEEAGRALEAEYTEGQKNSKRCGDIQKKITALTADLNERYKEKADLENIRPDNENGTHKYDFRECDSPVKKTGKVQ